MVAGPTVLQKRVSFNDNALTLVHIIEPLDDDQVRELFYEFDDYDRFRYERNLDIERSLRKQLHSNYRRATRRSSIDVMQSRCSSTTYSCMEQQQEPVAPNFRRATRRSSIDLVHISHQHDCQHTSCYQHPPRQREEEQENEYGYCSMEEAAPVADPITTMNTPPLIPLPSFQRATRRSSIDLMMAAASSQGQHSGGYRRPAPAHGAYVVHHHHDNVPVQETPVADKRFTPRCTRERVPRKTAVYSSLAADAGVALAA